MLGVRARRRRTRAYPGVPGRTRAYPGVPGDTVLTRVVVRCLNKFRDLCGALRKATSDFPSDTLDFKSDISDSAGTFTRPFEAAISSRRFWHGPPHTARPCREKGDITGMALPCLLGPLQGALGGV